MTHWTLIDIVNDLLCVVIAGCGHDCAGWPKNTRNGRRGVRSINNSRDSWRKTPLYAAPIATPEHDAKVRDEMLERVLARVRQSVSLEHALICIEELKSTGADHAK